MNCHPILALTPREKEVAALIREGLTDKEIAQKLCLSNRTIEDVVSSILQKLKVRNRTQLMLAINGNLKLDTEVTLSATNANILFRAKVFSLKKEEFTVQEIAKILNTYPQRIYYVYKQLGYSKKYKSYSQESIKEMREQGYSVEQIAKQFTISTSSVYRVLKEVSDVSA